MVLQGFRVALRGDELHVEWELVADWTRQVVDLVDVHLDDECLELVEESACHNQWIGARLTEATLLDWSAWWCDLTCVGQGEIVYKGFEAEA